jgi:hypothetical protein
MDGVRADVQHAESHDRKLPVCGFYGETESKVVERDGHGILQRDGRGD